jgi:hypothetical protein
MLFQNTAMNFSLTLQEHFGTPGNGQLYELKRKSWNERTFKRGIWSKELEPKEQKQYGIRLSQLRSNELGHDCPFVYFRRHQDLEFHSNFLLSRLKLLQPEDGRLLGFNAACILVEYIASIIIVTRIGELGTTSVVTSVTSHSS